MAAAPAAMAASALLNRIAAEHAAALGTGTTPADSHRRAALEALLKRGLPSGRDENWRYANLRPLEKTSFTPGSSIGSIEAAQLPAPTPGFTRFVFIDGQFAPALSATLGNGSTASVNRMQGPLPGAEEPFALLNEAFATDGVDVQVWAADAAADIEVVFHNASSSAAYPRLNVRLAPQARLRLIERHTGALGEAQLVNPAVRVELADGAALTHYRLQETGRSTTWTDSLSVRVRRDALYDLHLLQLGSLAARTSTDIELTGEAAAVKVRAVSLAEASQVHDHLILVNHRAARTRTEEEFRGIAADRARIAFNGMINVHAAAPGADSAQSLKGLIDGKDAEIDLRPQLEIHTDEVRCSHGATTGKLDDTMLFYLLTRGIDADLARRLLKWAFITDVVAKIDVADLRRDIQRSLAAHMQDARSLEDLLS